MFFRIIQNNRLPVLFVVYSVNSFQLNSMEHDKNFSVNSIPFRILYADDDEDDHFFFEDVLAKLKFEKRVKIFVDGEKLLTYLFEPKVKLPDVLFLDYNMPRKNGEECLLEIKKNPTLKDLPVIMYSTILNEDVADRLYDKGAYFFVCKTDMKSLEKILHKVFTLLFTKKAQRPTRAEFIISA